MIDATSSVVNWGVIPAGGSGERFQVSIGELPAEKQAGLVADKLMCVLPETGRAVLSQSAWALLTLVPCQRLMIAVSRDNLSVYQARLAEDLPPDLVARIDWTEGGATRRESVFQALRAIQTQIQQVELAAFQSNNTTTRTHSNSVFKTTQPHKSMALRAWVHDGARPWLSESLVSRLTEALYNPSVLAALPGLAVTDTVKVVNEQGLILETLDRTKCVTVQTPQVFDLDILMQAHSQVDATIQATDDAQLVELWRENTGAESVIQVVAGDPANRKITTASDLL